MQLSVKSLGSMPSIRKKSCKLKLCKMTSVICGKCYNCFVTLKTLGRDTKTCHKNCFNVSCKQENVKIVKLMSFICCNFSTGNAGD